MNFTTKINIPQAKNGLSYNDTFTLIGSCFTENIGNKLIRYGFKTNINPFGIIYNPISIADCLNSIIDNKEITENDLFFHNNLWHSYYHHGTFSNINKNECLNNCNAQINNSNFFLKNSNCIIFTFGSAWVYKLVNSDLVVGNCHKLPGTDFNKQLLQVSEIVSLYKECLQKLKEHNPLIKIIFTVSPVRHWKEGFRQNQISKSILHIAIHELQQYFDDILYFPAYEIMMDELRDYRFYNDDFLHPNTLAINYIWDIFCNTFFEAETSSTIEQVEKLQKMIEHRPFQAQTKAWELHIAKAKEVYDSLKKIHPEICLDYLNDILTK